MEKLETFIRVSCQFFVVNGPIFEEIFGGDVKMTVTTAGDSRGTHLTAYASTGSTLRSWLRPRPQDC